MANPENKKLWKIIFITLPLLTLSTFALFFKHFEQDEWILLTVATLVAQAELFWGIYHLAFTKKKPIGAPLTADKTYIAIGVIYILLFVAYLFVRHYAQSGYERLMLNLFPAYTAFSLLFPLSSLIGVLFKKVFRKR